MSVLLIRLKTSQFVLGTIDLRIDFRKLVCDDDNNGFELASTNEVAVDRKRWRQEMLAYRLG